MSCQRSPPPSPRAPKIQQESWDCGTPPIDLFDPCQDSPPRSPNRNQPPKSPKSPRKFNKPINVGYYEPRSPSMSSRTFNCGDQRSPKYENPPRSPKITTTYANDDDTSSSSFYQTPTGSRGSPKTTFYYENHQSPRRSPVSPRKFVFDAISPSYEQKGKKFEYYEPVTPDDEDNEMHRIGYKDSHHHHPKHSKSQQQSSSTSPPPQSHHLSQSSPSASSASSSSQQQQQLKKRRSRSFKSRPFDLKSPPDIEEPSASSGVAGGNGGRMSSKEFSGVEINEMMVATSGGNHQYQHHLTELTSLSGGRNNLFAKRDSCMTESTQLSGDSCETNTTTMTTTTTLITSSTDDGGRECPIANDCGGGGGGGGHPNTIIMNGDVGNCNGSNGTTSVAIRRPARGRRHAINITSNPGYQVLHSSHSTLDRTCSDSVVSLRCRKSTSDLTDVTEPTAPVVSKPRRRGSSKGGLAYLASRRSSRESIKSACSNTSIFSNEDIGPLAFQSSTRGRQRRTSNFLELPVPDHIRPRVCSLPDRPYNPRVSDDLYRLRHFSISKGTVVNCGDSIISRRSRSNTSVNSTTSRASERSPFDGSCCGGGYANVDSMPPSPTDSDPPPPPRYRIVMLGDAGVGKTALVSQFMTSEYMHTYDASLDDEFGEKTVSVLLDDEESELVFIDHPSVEMSVENSLSTYEPHACVVAYSVVDRNSFRVAEEIVNYLWREALTKDKAVILVGNKADLARSRVITTTEGKALAASRDAKFIETSSGIQHNVDELLVGILKQIRLKEKRDKKAALGAASKMKSSRTHISLHLAKEILQKICLSDITKSKSCENLHVL